MTMEPGPEAPHVRVHTLDGSYLALSKTPGSDVMHLLEELQDPDVELLSFDLDNGRSQVHVPRRAVARVDVDWEPSWLRRLSTWLLAQRDRLW